MVVYVAAIWRYPVKSLAGEPLESAEVTLDGVEGDRVVHVHGPVGVLTGRTRPGLLTLPVTTGAEGVPLVAGERWDSPGALQTVQEHAGPLAELAEYHGPERFDVGNLLVATDGAVTHFGHDVRRLRPNLLIGGVRGDAERRWPGKALAVGEVLIGVHSLRDRCVVTSVDPDTGERDPEVFKRIRKVFDGRLALNCWVIRPGRVSVGDQVELVRTKGQPAHLENLGPWTLDFVTSFCPRVSGGESEPDVVDVVVDGVVDSG
ncbi:MAG: MOSC domain-containing protein, partial [Acidimicrobiales bacterium]